MGVCGEVMSLVIYLHYGGWGPGDDSDRPAPQACAWIFVLQTVLCVCVNLGCHPILSDWLFFFFPPPPTRQGWSCHHGRPLRWTVTRSRSGTRQKSRAKGHDAAPAPKPTKSSRRRKRTRSTAKPLRITYTMKSLRSSKTTDNWTVLKLKKRNGCDVSFMNLVLKTTVFKVKAFRFPFSRSSCCQIQFSSTLSWTSQTTN